MHIDELVKAIGRAPDRLPDAPVLDTVLAALDEHAIVTITDRDGCILYVNRSFCERSKYSREELLGQNHRLLNSGHHPRAFFEILWSTISSGRTWRGALCNRAKDDSLYWAQSTIVPILGDDGRPALYVALRTDITALKAAENALAASEQRFRNLFEQDTDALLLLDLERARFVEANAAAVRMLRLDGAEAIAGCGPEAFSPPLQPDGRPSAEKIAEVIETVQREGSLRFEWWHCSARRDAFPVEVVLTVLKRDAGGLALVTWHDLGERKRAEAWQAHYTAILKDLAADLPTDALIEQILEFARQQSPGLCLVLDSNTSTDRRVACALPIRHAADSQALGILSAYLDREGPLSVDERAVLERCHDLLALVITRHRTRE
jgi:PAS domain S-box-containing protein